jgi:Pyruvate phosphate dikinase, AMP/ATP-binding domain
VVACRQQGAGVVGQVGRIVRVLDGRPITDDGPESSAALDISTVVWCTGSDADVCVTTDAHRRLAATAGLDKIVGAATGELLASTARARVTDRQVTELAALGDRVETHWGAPQDIEWAIDAGGTLWLTQARPITTLYPLPDPGGRQGCGAISVSASRRACTGRVVVGADPLGAGDGDGRPEFPWRRGRPRVRDTGGGRRSAGHRPVVDR